MTVSGLASMGTAKVVVFFRSLLFKGIEWGDEWEPWRNPGPAIQIHRQDQICQIRPESQKRSLFLHSPVSIIISPCLSIPSIWSWSEVLEDPQSWFSSPPLIDPFNEHWNGHDSKIRNAWQCWRKNRYLPEIAVRHWGALRWWRSCVWVRGAVPPWKHRRTRRPHQTWKPVGLVTKGVRFP